MRVCVCRPRPISFKSVLKHSIIHNRIEFVFLSFFLCVSLCVRNDMIYLYTSHIYMKEISKWNEDRQSCFSYFDIQHSLHTPFVRIYSDGFEWIDWEFVWKKHTRSDVSYWQFCVEMMQIKRHTSFRFYECARSGVCAQLLLSDTIQIGPKNGMLPLLFISFSFGFSLFLSDTKLFHYDGSDDDRRQNRFGMNRMNCVSEQKRSDNNGSWIGLDWCVCVFHSEKISEKWLIFYPYGETWKIGTRWKGRKRIIVRAAKCNWPDPELNGILNRKLAYSIVLCTVMISFHIWWSPDIPIFKPINIDRLSVPKGMWINNEQILSDGRWERNGIKVEEILNENLYSIAHTSTTLIGNQKSAQCSFCFIFFTPTNTHTHMRTNTYEKITMRRRLILMIRSRI